MIPIYWLIAFVALIGIEIATMALTTIWFAGGAIFAFPVSYQHRVSVGGICDYIILAAVPHPTVCIKVCQQSDSEDERGRTDW